MKLCDFMFPWTSGVIPNHHLTSQWPQTRTYTSGRMQEDGIFDEITQTSDRLLRVQHLSIMLYLTSSYLLKHLDWLPVVCSEHWSWLSVIGSEQSTESACSQSFAQSTERYFLVVCSEHRVCCRSEIPLAEVADGRLMFGEIKTGSLGFCFWFFDLG